MTLMHPLLTTITTLLIFFPHPTLQITEYVPDPASCSILGDGDVYGIGVRLGYYFAWASGLLAVAFDNSSAVRDARKGVSVISLAIFAILIRNTLNGSFAILEWSLVVPMVMWAPFLILLPRSLVDTQDRAGAAFFMCVMGLVMLVQPWVWFSRTQQGRREGCEARTFLYAYFDLFNEQYIGFQRFMAVMYCLGGCFLVGWAFVRFAAGLDARSEDSNSEGLQEGEARVEGQESGGGGGGGGQQQQQQNASAAAFDLPYDESDRFDRWFFRIFFIIFFGPAGITTIIFGERILAGNDVDLSGSPIGSSSQLIPLIVGLTGLISTVWSVAFGVYQKHVRRKESQGQGQAGSDGQAESGENQTGAQAEAANGSITGRVSGSLRRSGESQQDADQV
ncbi:hypothetical protein ASPCAL00253 [Aspergillus calidoustus]|uniref:Uncharacterized protein n=1 Tax=Aspergillus calidoustus TaxID=454130 RepID=A0A0U5FU96_ASPCI|nr:hypothetical protein ASPCAL00253 [Aspergillus calidoustus]